MKALEALNLNKVLGGLKDLSTIEASMRINIVKNILKLKKVTDELSEAMQTAREKVKPEGFDELIQKAEKHNEAISKGEEKIMSEEEITLLNLKTNKFNSELEKVLNEFQDREYELEMNLITEETFDILCKENNLSAAECTILYSLVG